MEHEPIAIADDDIEEGEISDSDDGYTPLQRPTNSSLGPNDGCSTSVSVTKMEEVSEQDSLEASSDSESDTGFKTKTKMSKLRINTNKVRPTANRTKPKNFNIWCDGLQEESLLENLKECGVDPSKKTDRDIESYDYSLKYRLNGKDENPLKRRLSNSDDSETNYGKKYKKRFRPMSFKKRDKYKNRPDHKSDDSSSNDGSMNAPRCIMDLKNTAQCSNEEIARQIANNLYEEKDDLMLRVVEVLGTEIPMELYNETKKIESEGGMLILNRMRRRTPGGVFLFLLKNCDKIQKEQKSQIFAEDSKKTNKEQKAAQAIKRNQKVEELKKSLKNENELTVLSTRSELALTHLNAENHTNLSNPPPSPVTDCNRENSSDFDTNDIQHVNVTSPEKAFSKTENAKCYEDDFLDVNCDPMDLF